MSNRHKAVGDAEHWAKRHRLAHNAYLNGKVMPLDKNTSRRFAAEFEHALRQRGEQAKERSQSR